MRINPRSSWGARLPKGVARIGKTTRLFLHHSVTNSSPAETILRSIQNYHMNSRGWQDIAYSFLASNDGRAWEGRGFFVAGGHTQGYNSSSHAVCAIGNFEASNPTAELLEALAFIAAEGYRQGAWSSKGYTGGHRDVAQTACPGVRLYNKIPEINRITNAMLSGKAPNTPKPAPAPSPSGRATIRRGSRGADVSTAQSLLNRIAGANLAVDGIFGAGTEAAVKNFQSFFRLGVDGIVGPKTWQALIDIDKVVKSKSQPKAKATIRSGSKGQLVKELQTKLNKVGGAGLVVDGNFGPATDRAVRNFQKFFKLGVDGIVGAKTWGMLDYTYSLRSN